MQDHNTPSTKVPFCQVCRLQKGGYLSAPPLKTTFQNELDNYSSKAEQPRPEGPREQNV